jgi:methionine synthase II (cobalamin-independent)
MMTPFAFSTNIPTLPLRNARHSLRSREITTAEIKKIEDRAVDETIALQEAAELDLFWLLW